MKAIVLVMIACALAPFAERPAAGAHAPADTAFAEWPIAWEGHAMRPLALSPVERRFAERFPGRIGRFSAGPFVLVLREVREPTRMLHPATDCYRGLGYAVSGAHLERDGEQRIWRCFVAERDGRRVRVCERIEDARGQSFADASAWYWEALLGRSAGPWRAVTRVEAS